MNFNWKESRGIFHVEFVYYEGLVFLAPVISPRVDFLFGTSLSRLAVLYLISFPCILLLILYIITASGMLLRVISHGDTTCCFLYRDSFILLRLVILQLWCVIHVDSISRSCKDAQRDRKTIDSPAQSLGFGVHAGSNGIFILCFVESSRDANKLGAKALH